MPPKKDADTATPEREPIEVQGHAVERVGDAGLDRYIPADSPLLLEDSDAAYRQIIDQIMDARSAEEVLTPTEALDAEEVKNWKLKCKGFRLNRSEFEAGAPFYASIQCVKADDGRDVIVNTGHQALIAQLMKLHSLDAFPCNIMFYEAGRANRNGGVPMRIKGW
jgi:hypothetical protein